MVNGARTRCAHLNPQPFIHMAITDKPTADPRANCFMIGPLLHLTPYVADVLSGLGEADGFMDFVAEPPQHHSCHPTTTTTTTTPSALNAMPSTAAESRNADKSFYTLDPSNWSSLDNSPPSEPYYDAAAALDSGFILPQSCNFTLHFSPQTTQRFFSTIDTSKISSTIPYSNGVSMSTPAAAANAAVKASMKLQTDLNTLMPAQPEKLKTPSHFQYHSPKSISSSESRNDLNSSPGRAEPAKPASRKRKSSSAENNNDEDLPIKKTVHNMIKNRYRTNLNNKIVVLRDSVPTLRIMSKSARGESMMEDREELHGLTPAHKLNKDTVCISACVSLHFNY